MPYNKLLMKIVAESGKTHKEIVAECNKAGLKIDKTTFSKLINNKKKPPAKEVSEAICTACNVDKRILNIEKNLDEATEEIQKAFMNLKTQALIPALKIFENEFDENTFKEVEKIVKNEPLYDIVLSLADNDTQFLSEDTNITFEGEQDHISFTLQDLVALEMKDDSMEDKIKKGSKINVTMQEVYEDGDIIAITVKEEKDYIVRCALFNDDIIVLKALNKNYKSLKYKQEDINILGKVTRVITDI